MTEQRAQLQKILDLAAKHRERADDRETAAGVAEQRAQVAALDAARHRARLDALLYAISLIREIADRWIDTANEYGSLVCPVNDAVEQAYNENAKALDELAFRLLSEVDES